MKILLFDVDLTLVVTGGAGVRALDRALEEVLGVAHAMESITPHGKTDPLIVREVCERQDHPESIDIEAVTPDILGRYLGYLETEVAVSTQYRILPGIRELLEDIHGMAEVGLGLATGNLERGARIKLERGGLNPYFSFGGFGSDAEDRAEMVRHAARRGGALFPGVKARDVFVIGDTPRDIDAGQRAGFQTVGVATGPYPVRTLEAAGADLVIEDFSAGRDQFLRATRIL